MGFRTKEKLSINLPLTHKYTQLVVEPGSENQVTFIPGHFDLEKKKKAKKYPNIFSKILLTC